MNGEKGQFSFSWSVFAGGIAVLTTAFFYIIVDQSRAAGAQAILDAGADTTEMALFDSIFSLAPIVVLASFGIFLWITAAATRDRDTL